MCFDQNAAALANGKVFAEQMQNAAENVVKEQAEENEQLKRTIKELEGKSKDLHQQIDHLNREQELMREKVKRNEVSCTSNL